MTRLAVPERVAGATTLIAVFLSGAVLLGSRSPPAVCVAPFFGNSLFVWGALIGVVLDRARDRLLGRRRARRPLADARLLVAAITLGAAAACSRSRCSTSPSSRRSSAGTPARAPTRSSPPCCCSALPSIVLASVTPIAVRLRAGGWRTSGAPRAGCSRSRPSAASSATFVTAFWLDPGARHRPAARHRRRRALRSGGGRRSRRPARRAVPRRGGRRRRSRRCPRRSLAPETGGTLSSVAARNWSPVYRLLEDRARPERRYAAHRRSSTQKDTRYHQLAVVEEAEARAPLRQLVPERDVRRRPVSDCVPLHRLLLRSGRPTTRRRKTCSSSGSAAARRRSDSGATSRSFDAGRRARPRRGRRRPPLLRRAATTPVAVDDRRRPPLPDRATTRAGM